MPLLKAIVVFVERQFWVAIKIIRFDNSLELKNMLVLELYKSKGTIHQTSCVDGTQQNGVVERKYWLKTLLIAIYLINRKLIALLNNKPFFSFYTVQSFLVNN